MDVDRMGPIVEPHIASWRTANSCTPTPARDAASFMTNDEMADVA
jgi:hypothetical protein